MATLVRPVRSSDKAPLMEFISRLWGGHDYIPKVWDAWISERNARMLVAEVDGKPIGMNRVKFLDDGSAWLEGARIHPAFRGKGLASTLGKNSISLASRRGVATFRLATNSRNRSARKQIAKMGFHELARMSIYNPKRGARLTSQTGVRLAALSDVGALTNLITRSKEFKSGGGVFWDGFRATGLNARTIALLVRERRALVSGDAVAFLKRGKEGTEPFTQICFACGGANDVVRLIKHTFGRWGRRNTLCYLSAPQGSPLIGNAKKAGLTRWSTFILFQKTGAQGLKPRRGAEHTWKKKSGN